MLAKLGCIISILLSFVSASAYDFVVDGIYYNVTDLAKLECEVTHGDEKYKGKIYFPSNQEEKVGGELIIPATVTLNSKTFKVIGIGDEACYNCSALVRVGIPSSVTYIGNKAFCVCERLSEIEIPDSVLTIGEKAFEYCKELKSVSIGNSVTDIGNSAFYNCENLKVLKIGASVKSIGKGAFVNCKSLERVVLPNSVEYLGENAFSECKSLSKMILSDNLKVLEPGTFNRCPNLEEIEIPGSVERIVGNRLYGGSDLFSDLQILYLNYSEKEVVWGEYKRMYDKGDDNWGYSVFTEGANTKDSNFSTGQNWFLGLKVVNFNREIKPAMRLPQVVKLYFGSKLKSVPISDIQKCEHLSIIVCRSTEPPVLPECSTKQYLNVIVKVPEEALDKYRQAPVWKEFLNIEGYAPSEVGKI